MRQIPSASCQRSTLALCCWPRPALGVSTMLMLAWMLGLTPTRAAEAAEEVRAYGLRPPTVRDQAWMDLNLETTRRVLPNDLGLARLNLQRRAKGLTELKAATVPVGAESQPDPSASIPGGMDIPDSASLKDGVGAALPAAVDNSALPSFPPVRSQGSLGSCAAFSTTYYAATHMLGLARGWNNKDDADNTRKLSPKWTYNFANDGADAGAWFSTIMDVLLKLGCPTWSEFPYVGVGTNPTNYLEWSRDAAVWRGAAARRFQQIGRVQQIDTTSGLANAKALLANGYALLYATHVSSWQFMPFTDDPGTTADNALVGRPCGWKVSALANSGHAMTLVGYDDDVWIDINKNGAADSGEKGALKVVNSWGTSWWEAGTDGYGWIAYDALKASSAIAGVGSSDRQCAFWNSEVYWITARASYTPTLLGQFTLSSAARNQLGLRVGTSATSTTTPLTTFPTTTSFGWANNSDAWPQALENLGGSYGFGGTSAAVGGTFALDLTDLAQSGARRYYVEVQDNRPGAAATLNDFRLVTAGGTVLATVTAGLPRTADGSLVRAYADFATSATPVISSASRATATVGQAFSYTISATNSPTSFGANSLAPGLLLDPSTGTITGTPTQPGASYIVGISAANAGGVGTGTLTLTIGTQLIATPRLTSPTTASGTVGVPFTYTITASNSPGSFGASGLPPGLALDVGSGVVSGTPTQAGSYAVVLSAVNAGGAGTGSLVLSVDPASVLAPVITSSNTAAGVRGSDFTYRIEASHDPTLFAALGLPSSLHLDDVTGSITGTLPATGSYPITLSASNAAGSGYLVLLLTVTGSSIYGPANDAFANRIPVSGTAVDTTGTTVDASAESGEPAHFDTLPASRSVWWTWTAPTGGLATIDTEGSEIDTLLAVYTGSAVDSLALTAHDDDSGAGYTSRVSFSAVAGNTYQIAVDGLGGAEGPVMLALRQTEGTGPANDAFANRIVLSGALATDSGANQAATAEAGEPAHAGFAATCSVWWTWTAPSAGQVTIDTIDSDFDTLLAVYRGTALTALTPVAADDQSGGGNTSLTAFAVTAGTTYQIAVDGWHGETGGVQLHLDLQGAAATNDAFARRSTMSGAAVSTTGSNLNATAEAGEPPHAGYGARRSVWWTWTAPGTGVATIDTEGSSFDTLLAVYSGATLAGLAQVAADDDGGAATSSRLAFYASGGATYHIAVDGYGGAAGSIALHLALSTGSSNDDFAHRATLAGSSATYSGGNVGATAETAEPNHGDYSPASSVWWTWVAPGNGMVTITTAGSTFDTVLAVYQGATLAGLTRVVANDDASSDLSSQVSFFATTGAVFQIAVDGYEGAEGSLILALSQSASSVLYSTDFEDFPTGLGALAGHDGWSATDDPTLGTYGVYAAASQAAWVGFNYTSAESVYAYRPVNYNPLVADMPVVRFSVDLAVYDSSSAAHDFFGFFLFNSNGDYLAQILFDPLDLSVWFGNGAGFTEVGTFVSNTPQRLEARMDFAINRCSATLDGSPLFSDHVLHAGSAALTLGEMAAGWQIGTAGAPGDNFMTFDNYRLAVDAAPSIVTASPLPPGQVGMPYEQPLAAEGGSAPYTWSVTAGSLPRGLDLSGDGVIGGTPVAEGPGATFVVQVTGSNGLSASGSFSLTVSSGCAPHQADQDADWTLQLAPELTRLIQFYNLGGYHCRAGTEDGYAPGTGDRTCAPHQADQDGDWQIQLSPELTRMIQFHNSAGYHCADGTEDGYAPVLGGAKSTAKPGTLAATRIVAYPSPGDALIEVSLTLQHSEPRTLTSLAVEESIPSGWQFTAVCGPTLPALAPFPGAAGRLAFAWVSMPTEWPVRLVYRLRRVATAQAEQTISGKAGFRQDSAEVRVTIPATPVDASVTVRFLAGEHGALEGAVEQTIPWSTDTLPVTAVAAPGYVFEHWSDGSSANPRVLTQVTADQTLTAAFLPAAAVAPSGEFQALVGSDGTVAGRGLWDLSGTYLGAVGSHPLVLGLVHDTDGRLAGTATYRVTPNTLLSMPIRGSVTGAADGIVVKLALAGSDAAGTVAVSVALTLTVDPARMQLVGPLVGSVVSNGNAAPLHEVMALAMPTPMDGTWALRFQLGQSGKQVSGTAVLILSNGVSQALVTRGRMVGQELALTLSSVPGDPAANGIRIRTTLVPLAGGWARLQNGSLLGYGQSLLWP